MIRAALTGRRFCAINTLLLMRWFGNYDFVCNGLKRREGGVFSMADVTDFAKTGADIK